MIHSLIVRLSKYMTSKLNSEIIEHIFVVMKTVKHKMSLCSESSHITAVQFDALKFISANKQVTMSQISDYFSTSMPTATSLVDKLISSKLVTRKDDLKDRRIIKINLTKLGEKILAKAFKSRTNSMNKMLSYLSQSDKKELLRIFKKIVDKTNEK